ncbi:MAG: hypothetical protein EBU92_12195 [Betaproteobacteria bacterium]|nr:hypothetical protein [Betaproteobacteria bacterium]
MADPETQMKKIKNVCDNFKNTSTLIRDAIVTVVTHQHVDGITESIREIIDGLLVLQTARAQRWTNNYPELFEILHERLKNACHQFISAHTDDREALLPTVDRLIEAENALVDNWYKMHEESLNNQ